mmetsp:Transcript_21725/g.49114  ORF Transcript_21725/g.49114 Transcript_21725/m.49114 type:complete len:303 (-) Transcript_21725:132-1040(-)
MRGLLIIFVSVHLVASLDFRAASSFALLDRDSGQTYGGTCACQKGCALQLLQEKGALDTLDEIGLKSGTDKASSQHDFLDFYDGFLHGVRFSARHVLEVGVKGGASLLAWASYFPCATIYGWDKFDGCLRAKKSVASGAVTAVADQFRLESLDTAAFDLPLLDLVVDDGMHSTLTMVHSLVALWPKVAPGGYYIAEDLHACMHGTRGRWCDQRRGHPTMFEILSNVSEHGASVAVHLARRFGFPRFGNWVAMSRELDLIKIYAGPRGCSMGLGWGAEHGGCAHVTAVLRKRGIFSPPETTAR